MYSNTHSNGSSGHSRFSVIMVTIIIIIIIIIMFICKAQIQRLIFKCTVQMLLTYAKYHKMIVNYPVCPELCCLPKFRPPKYNI